MAATAHDINLVAAGISSAAADAGVTLPVDYARRVTADGLAVESKLAVTRLGVGVVIHTVPDSDRRLPLLLGYADHRGQWYRDGRRHLPTSTVDTTVTPSAQVTL